MLPDIVIPCRPGDNEELRYALRSLKNIPHRDVWIIGGMPDWVRNVRFYEYPRSTTKYETTTQHVVTACTHPEISDPFILMNDDFYVMHPLRSLPILNRGTVARVIADYEQRGIQSSYVDGMRATLARLEQHGHKNPLSFELHVPLTVHKKPMLTALDMCTGIPVAHKRTAYAAVAGLKGRTVKDVKVSETGATIPTGAFLSSSDDTFDYLRPTLEAAFPDPGPYEA